ncbi:MAG: DMT family transporter [Pseudomonadota bacterium]
MTGVQGAEAADPGARVVALTAAAIVAFAANSLLCRAALVLVEGTAAADPLSFTFLRLASGAVCLGLLVLLRPRRQMAGQGAAPGLLAELGRGWGMVLALLVYMAGFSFAYVSLDAATGALILFGAVQATMMGVALAGGERPGPWGWAGIGLAAVGLVVLFFPGLSAPDPVGAALMVAAGIGWGAYSLAGRGASDPLQVTARNFSRASLLFFPAALIALNTGLTAAPMVSMLGIVLAVTSGAVASGIGYALWYAALPSLGAGRGAIVQLAVPVIAAAGGVILLAEPLDWRLALATPAVIGGILLYLKRPR